DRLGEADELLRCSRCGTVVPVREGIPVFARDPDYFYGELSREEMLRLRDSTRLHGWDRAFLETLDRLDAKMRAFLEPHILDESRAAWKFLLHLPRGGRALDLGCGWGPVSVSLARSMAEVVSMDLNLERLLVLRERALSQGLSNITCVQGGDTARLPFADKSF